MIGTIDFSLLGPAITTKTTENIKYLLVKSNSNDLLQRNIHTINTIFNELKDCTDILIEDYAYNARGKGKSSIMEVLGAIKYMLLKYNRNLRIYTVAPKSLKKFITGNGNATKDDMMDCISKMINNKISDDNIADAIGLNYMLQEHLINPISVIHEWRK